MRLQYIRVCLYNKYTHTNCSYTFIHVCRVNPVETAQYKTVTAGSTKSKEKSGDAEYKVMEGVGGTYEEVDKLRQPHPPREEHELSQCAAY